MTNFVPLEWQKEPWKSKVQVLLLSGSAGSGKTVLAAEKIVALALKYPGCKILVLRKSRAAAMQTVVDAIDAACGDIDGIVWRPTRFRYYFPNGSQIILGGLFDEKQRQAIRSFTIDFAWIEEANKITREDYNEVSARMRGTVAGWNQIILSTNPDSDSHWIYTDLISNAKDDPRIGYYPSGAIDNPHLPDSYIQTLQNLTGVQRERLWLGNWARATGTVYEEWEDDFDYREDPSGNVQEDARYIPYGGPVIWFVDDGYYGERKNGRWSAKSHPRAVLFAQIRDSGQIAVFHESYAAKKSASSHIRELLELSHDRGYGAPEYVVRDRAAASIGQAFKDVGIKAKYGTMKIEDSINLVAQYIKADQNGVRRIIVAPECKDLRAEMASYVRHYSGRPEKAFDHGPDALRYGVWDNAFGGISVVDIATYDTVEEDFLTLRNAKRRSKEDGTGIVLLKGSTPGVDIAF